MLAVMFPGRIRESGECFQINILERSWMVGTLKLAAAQLEKMSFGEMNVGVAAWDEGSWHAIAFMADLPRAEQCGRGSFNEKSDITHVPVHVMSP